MKVVAVFLLFLGVALACDNDEFDCGNGYCIPDNWLCDGWDDCNDGNDEVQYNCDNHSPDSGPQYECTVHQRPCDNIGCVPLNWVCDGMDDCGDNSDEQNCPDDSGPSAPQCSSSQFECANSHCIYSSWVCDGDNDCGDNSDEQGCSGPDPDPVSPFGCSSDRFECDNGRCIPASWECDDWDDCGDNSDEDHCSSNPDPVVNPDTPCGGKLKDDVGVITHLNYDNSMDCEWEITVSPGNYIFMEFTSFELEGSSSCRFDYLEIYDGLSNSAPLLAKLCGDELPKPIESTGNRVSVQFTSDHSVSKDGFEMKYYAVDDGTGSGEGSGSVVDTRDRDAFIF